MIETNQNPAKILKPSVCPLNFPPAAIAPKFSSVLNFDLLIRSLRTDQINLSIFLQPLAKRKTVCSSVIDQSRKPLSRSSLSLTVNSNCIKSFLYQRRFVGRCGSKLKPDRYALTICHHHKLCSLPALGFSDAFAPFLRVKMFHPQKTLPT